MIRFGDYPIISVPPHSTTVNPSRAVASGRICAAPAVSCPPAIPIAVSGEIITDEHIRMFEYYDIEKIVVLK
jgi:hypothetical protein